VAVDMWITPTACVDTPYAYVDSLLGVLYLGYFDFQNIFELSTFDRVEKKDKQAK
jgi:hypothetical protein